MSELKRKTVSGTLWSAVERLSVQGVVFVVTIVMANYVTPGEFGLVGMLAVFTAIGQSLVDAGFTQALIRKQDRSELDNSTVFWFNLAMGVALYGVLFVCAVPISRFYDQPELAPMVRVLGLILPLNALAVVQRALLTVRIDFRTQAKATLVAALVSGGTGIWLAVRGAGAWALVWQQIVNAAVLALLLWIVTGWRPRPVWSGESFGSLFGFGSRLAAAGLIDTLYRQGWPLVIGKFFPAATLGYYTNAHKFADFPSSNLTGILQRVTYPVLCTIQDDPQRLGEAYRRFLRLAAFCVFPLMTGLAGVAQPLIVISMGAEWAFAAVLLQIICLQMMWYPVHAINLNLLQVLGRSDLFLKLEVYKKICGVAILCVTVPFGIQAMCWGGVATSLVALVINTSANGRLAGLGLWRQLRDMAGPLAGSLSMGAVVWLVVLALPESNWLRLCAGICAGVVWYLGLAWLTRSEDLRMLLDLVRRRSSGESRDR